MEQSIWFASLSTVIICCALLNISSHINGIRKFKKYNPNKIRTKDGLVLMLSNNVHAYKFFKEKVETETNKGDKLKYPKWEYFVKVDFINPIEKETSKIYEVSMYEYDLHAKG